MSAICAASPASFAMTCCTPPVWVIVKMCVVLLSSKGITCAPLSWICACRLGTARLSQPLIADDSRIFSSKVVCGSPRLGKDHRFLDRQPTDDLIELQRTLGVKMSES